MSAHALTDTQRQRIFEQHEENGVQRALHEADLYRPKDADKTEWLTEVFRDLELAEEGEEVIDERRGGLAIREIARETTCPRCGERADHVVEDPERLSTPTMIGHAWEVCVSDDSLYVHNSEDIEYIGRETRR